MADIHPARQGEINKALKKLMENPSVPKELKDKLGYRYDQPKWEQISLDEIKPHLGILGENERKRILFTILMQASTMKAVEIMRRETWDLQELAPEINYQHELLRDLYDVSLPELERIRDAMLKAGALAVKLSGAGLGGSLVALVESDEEEIIKSALLAGAKQAWKVRPDEGARIEQ